MLMQAQLIIQPTKGLLTYLLFYLSDREPPASVCDATTMLWKDIAGMIKIKNQSLLIGSIFWAVR